MLKNKLPRTLLLLFLASAPMACASTFSISPNNSILSEELRRLPTAEPFASHVAIIVKAQEQMGSKPGRIGEPYFVLQFSAQQMLQEVTDALARS